MSDTALLADATYQWRIKRETYKGQKITTSWPEERGFHWEERRRRFVDGTGRVRVVHERRLVSEWETAR